MVNTSPSDQYKNNKLQLLDCVAYIDGYLTSKSHPYNILVTYVETSSCQPSAPWKDTGINQLVLVLLVDRDVLSRT